MTEEPNPFLPQERQKKPKIDAVPVNDEVMLLSHPSETQPGMMDVSIVLSVQVPLALMGRKDYNRLIKTAQTDDQVARHFLVAANHCLKGNCLNLHHD